MFRVKDDELHIVVSTMVWDQVTVEFLIDWSHLWADYYESDWPAHLYMNVVSSCLIMNARNLICARSFQHHPELTHLLMVDSDVMGLRPRHIQRMAAHNVPIVSALVTKYDPPFNPACESEDGFEAVYAEMEKDEPGIVERRWTGTGCILIRRDVLERMVIPCEALGGEAASLWFRQGRQERFGWDRDLQDHIRQQVDRAVRLFGDDGATADGKGVVDSLIDLFMESFLTGRGVWDGGVLCGEDVDFGLRARAAGFRSYVDCGVKLAHFGPHGRTVEDHLRSLNRELKRGGRDKKAVHAGVT